MDVESFAEFVPHMLNVNPGLLIQILQTKSTARLAAIYNELDEQPLAVITQLMLPTADAAMLLQDVPLIAPPPLIVVPAPGLPPAPVIEPAVPVGPEPELVPPVEEESEEETDVTEAG
jgi:hypothetical protein